ncbi:GNAT family N-acetyltransferase [Vibrio amylolyticus]|uniref:GNAT family N-acetyltransferase n=1 Tax=Vibrio amylolyticus TaxID=2847292 RepID=UPI00354ED943
MEVTIPQKSELEELNHLIVAAKKSWGYSQEQIDMWLPSLIATETTLCDRDYRLARNDDGQPVFVYSLAALSSGIYELEDCWVAPEFKGHGYGRKMFEHMVQNLESKQAHKLEIVSDPNAEGFYRRMGAVKVGETLSSSSGRYLPKLELVFGTAP